jgi:hypothetical protein
VPWGVRRWTEEQRRSVGLDAAAQVAKCGSVRSVRLEVPWRTAPGPAALPHRPHSLSKVEALHGGGR